MQGESSARTSFLASRNPTFHISDPLSLATTGSHLDRQASASTSSLIDAAFPTEQASLGADGRRGELNWVARPRNEFILFRCDFVRNHHSGEGKPGCRLPGRDTEKTLSKKAAEAWHSLPPDERLYWKEKADGERTEHARRYPDYRYRPRKNLGHKRSARSLSIQTPSQDPRSCQSVGFPDLTRKQPLSSRLLFFLPSGSSHPVGRRRALPVPSSTIAYPQFPPQESGVGDNSPPASAPPTKVLFGPEVQQMPTPRGPILSRYRSTPLFSPETLNHDTHTIPVLGLPLHSTGPSPTRLRGQSNVQTSPHSPMISLSALSLVEDPGLSQYTTGGGPLDAASYGYSTNAEAGIRPPPPTWPKEVSFLPPTNPLSRSTNGNLDFSAFRYAPGDLTGLDPRHTVPFIEHDHIGRVCALPSQQPWYAVENNQFVSPDV